MYADKTISFLGSLVVSRDENVNILDIVQKN